MADTQMGFAQFARIVLDALAAAKVEYLIGGSVAVWAWGEARTTLDFDLVINLPIARIYHLSKQLERHNMLVPPDVIVDLVIQQDGDVPINAIHMGTNYKAELFLLRPDDLFRQNAFTRRQVVNLGPPIGEAYVHAPEDLILYKVRYYAISYQTKHVRDIASILEASYDLIDFDYLEQWVKTLGLEAPWQEIWTHFLHDRGNPD